METVGPGSMDAYAQQLARRLPVDVLRTRVFQQSANAFGVPLLSPRAAVLARRDAAFVRRLRRVAGAVHLPNQHLARYARFLSTPFVITVHDVMRYIDCVEGRGLIHEPNRRDRVLLELDAAGIRRAAAVIAPSHATRADLERLLGVPSDRVHLVPLAIDPAVFRPVARRLLEDPYVLCVGKEQPRKNLDGALRAFARVKSGGAYPDLKLVKVGIPGFSGEDSLRERTRRTVAALGLERDVILAGRVDVAELVAWYSGAVSLLFPSRYEGFGFTVLEAMACGCPVITSNRSSLPEVAGDAALLVDPDDDDDIAGALARVVSDDETRARLVRAGHERALEWTWDDVAARTLGVYAAMSSTGPASGAGTRQTSENPSSSRGTTRRRRVPRMPGTGIRSGAGRRALRAIAVRASTSNQ